MERTMRHHAPSLAMCFLLLVAVVNAAPLPSVDISHADPAQASQLRALCESESWWIQLGDLFFSPALGEADPNPDHYLVLHGAPVPYHLLDAVAAKHLGKAILYLPDGPPADLHGTNCPECPFEGIFTSLPINQALITQDMPGTPLPTGIPDYLIARILESVSVDFYTSVVATLTNIDSRCTHTDGNDTARDYLAAEFAALGLDVELQYYDPQLRGIGYTNVIGRLTGSRYPDEVILIGGHYDSLPCPPLAGPGAEDNASGAAGILEAARVLSQARPLPQRTILFVPFSAEEQGLLGSRYFVSQMTSQQRANFRGALIMDMIAYDSDQIWDVNVEINATHANFASTVIDASDAFTSLTRYWVNTSGRSDHQPFLDIGLPAVLIIESEWMDYPYYHTSLDTFDRIEPAFGAEVVKMSIASALRLANPDPVSPAGMMLTGPPTPAVSP